MFMGTHSETWPQKSIYTFLLYVGNTKGRLQMQHPNVSVLQKKFKVKFRSIIYTTPHITYYSNIQQHLMADWLFT